MFSLYTLRKKDEQWLKEEGYTTVSYKDSRKSSRRTPWIRH